VLKDANFSMAQSNGKIERRYWTAKEAAAYIPVCVTTLYQWVGVAEGKKIAGKISKLHGPPPPFRRFGHNKLMFPVERFKTWADAPN
jgi:hypothetical protein